MEWSEEVKIVKTKFIRGEGGQTIEGSAILSAYDRIKQNDVTLDCFLGSGLPIIELEKSGLRSGDLVNTVLSVVIFNYKFGRAVRSKSIRQIKRSPTAVNTSIITGEIVEAVASRETPDLYSVVIDCGVYVTGKVKSSELLKAGYYINLEGRLDAKIIGKA